MNDNQKMQAIEYLRSCAIQAHEMIQAIRKSNYGDARELLSDCQSDLEKVSELLPEE